MVNKEQRSKLIIKTVESFVASKFAENFPALHEELAINIFYKTIAIDS